MSTDTPRGADLGPRRRILVVSAGLREPSSTRLLADRLSSAAVTSLAAQGIAADVEVVELREYAHDLADHLLTGFPNARLRPALDALGTADAVIAVTPIFNASYSGLFKTYFDLVEPDTLADRPVLLGATGGTGRHSLALEHALRPMFSYLHAVVVPTAVYAATEDWGVSGNGTGLVSRIDRAATELAALVATREPAAPADPFAGTASFEDLLRR